VLVHILYNMETAMDSGTYLKSWLKLPSDAQSNLSKALDPKSYVKAYWNDKTRPDGRMFPQARPTEVVSSLLKHSAGSALIKQGNTKVLSAMTVQIGQPAPELPDHGDIVVSVTTLDQFSHSDVLQSWLQRMLDDLLPSKLALIKGKACIRLVVTVMILQDDGNLRDVALTACMAAWKDTTLPTMEDLTEHDGKLWWTKSPITSVAERNPKKSSETYRVSLSMGIVEKNAEILFLVDPSAEESRYTTGMLTVVVTMPGRALQMEYSGSAAISATDLALASAMANGRVDELASILQ
jgi:exosome complex component RRP42